MKRPNGVNPESNLHVKLLSLIKLINIHLNHFPKHEKFALCNQIRMCMYDVYNLVTICNKNYGSKNALHSLDVKHEQLRMLLKLAFELGYYNYKQGTASNSAEPIRRYLAVSSMIDEIGSMIGGWVNK